MRIKPIVLFLVIAGLAAFVMLHRSPTMLVEVGKPAPDFTIKDPNGKEVKLSDFRGKVVFLNLWATWCAPCVQEVPEIEEMTRRFKDRKFEVMAVTTDSDWKTVTAFYEDHHLTFPSYHDPGWQVANLYHVRAFPETFLIDGNGIVLKHTVGQDHWAAPSNLAAMDNLIKEQETASSASK